MDLWQFRSQSATCPSWTHAEKMTRFEPEEPFTPGCLWRGGVRMEGGGIPSKVGSVGFALEGV